MKLALKEVSWFRVLFTRPLVLTIDIKLNFLYVFAKPYDRLDNLKLYSVFESGFLIDYALSLSRFIHLSLSMVIHLSIFRFINLNLSRVIHTSKSPYQGSYILSVSRVTQTKNLF